MLTEVQYNFLNGITNEVVFRNADEEALLDLILFLGGKGIFYKLSPVNDEHTMVRRVVDEETIDCMEEDLECLWLFTDFSKTEREVARTIKALMLSKAKNLCIFMTPEAIKDVRWDLIAYAHSDFDFTVLLNKGVVEIEQLD